MRSQDADDVRADAAKWSLDGVARSLGILRLVVSCDLKESIEGDRCKPPARTGNFESRGMRD